MKPRRWQLLPLAIREKHACCIPFYLETNRLTPLVVLLSSFAAAEPVQQDAHDPQIPLHPSEERGDESYSSHENYRANPHKTDTVGGAGTSLEDGMGLALTTTV